ncbi:hypothetical protein LUZ61_006035 [Rhynchospora tenuis]|uniref:Uncharacterized protein n=1 Tax=Rhynchospora tenuis TaxID=198213 RepID=A0AAD5ZQY6_9POAL|nr:hypothetical protein LUZ61_006035 [Rhynchospora tenuis]
MDSDLWISRLAAAKRHYAAQLQNNSFQSSDRVGIDEFEVEDEIRPEFPCPYCYEDHDVTSLCAHLEEEHPFESRAAVCPVCSDKINRDMLNHLTVQHGHLFKNRRRLRRFVIPSSQAISLLSRDLREAHLQVLLGTGGFSRSNNHNSSQNNTPANIASDPLLSSLVLNFPPPGETDDGSKSSSSVGIDEAFAIKDVPSHTLKKPSFDLSLSYEEREHRRKQASVRATFVQDLLLSTLLYD